MSTHVRCVDSRARRGRWQPRSRKGRHRDRLCSPIHWPDRIQGASLSDGPSVSAHLLPPTRVTWRGSRSTTTETCAWNSWNPPGVACRAPALNGCRLAYRVEASSFCGPESCSYRWILSMGRNRFDSGWHVSEMSCVGTRTHRRSNRAAMVPVPSPPSRVLAPQCRLAQRPSCRTQRPRYVSGHCGIEVPDSRL